MKYQDLILKKEGHVGILTLNRPEKLNPIRLRVFPAELSQALDEITQDSEIRVLIVTGAGRSFCAGGDLDDINDVIEAGVEEIRTLNWSLDRAILKLRNLEQPTIASVNGHALGGGAGLALNCDIIIASDNAQFGWVFPRIGMTGAEQGSGYLLPRKVGLARACELLLTGRIIDAYEAERIGLVSRVVPAKDLEAETKKLANTMAQLSPPGLAATKLSIYKGLDMDAASELEYEIACETMTMLTEDHAEGMRAFGAKEKPNFKAR